MAPKRSDVQHVTFHFYRSSVLLSVPASTNVGLLKTQLLPALQPFENILPVKIPSQASDIRIYEQNSTGDLTKLSPIDDDAVKVQDLGVDRWKTVFVSFRGDDGFSDPVYTLPDLDDED